MSDETYWAFVGYMRDEIREQKRAANRRRK
jgi:hypothetical protein